MSFIDLLKSPAALTVIGTVMLGSTVGYVVIQKTSPLEQKSPDQTASHTTPAPSQGTNNDAGKITIIPNGFLVQVSGTITVPSLTPGIPEHQEQINKQFPCPWRFDGNLSCVSPSLSKKAFGSTITMKHDTNDPTTMIVKGFFGDMSGTRYTWEQLKGGVKVSGLTLTAKN